MKVTAYVSAIRYYEATFDVDSKEEAEKIAKEMYNNGDMNDYEDELMSIEIVAEGENDG
nr:MAG TPA: PcfM DpnD/PcfM-like protein [Caudoviricetes sp.]